METTPKASGCFMGGTRWFEGGTNKAEAAKLPDAGISPKQWPKNNVRQKKRRVPQSVKFGCGERIRVPVQRWIELYGARKRSNAEGCEA